MAILLCRTKNMARRLLSAYLGRYRGATSRKNWHNNMTEYTSKTVVAAGRAAWQIQQQCSYDVAFFDEKVILVMNSKIIHKVQ